MEIPTTLASACFVTITGELKHLQQVLRGSSHDFSQNKQTAHRPWNRKSSSYQTDPPLKKNDKESSRSPFGAFSPPFPHRQDLLCRSSSLIHVSLESSLLIAGPLSPIQITSGLELDLLFTSATQLSVSCLLSSPEAEPAMQQQPAKPSNGLCSVLAVILALTVLDLAVLIARYFYSTLRYFLQHFLQHRQCQLLPTHQSRAERILDGKSADEVKLSGVEVKLVMERLGIFGNPEADDGSQEDVVATQVAGLFDDPELSLEEVEEAFDVFDRNCDGFIDARELCSFLCSFGFLHISEDDCRGMIRAIDDNGDGVVDLREFTKLVEKSL